MAAIKLGDDAGVVRVLRVYDDPLPPPGPVKVTWDDAPAGEYVLRGWTREEWAALPVEERPVGWFEFGTMIAHKRYVGPSWKG